MQETDREIRESQKLKAPEEYVDYLNLLLPATKFNNKHVKNAIERASQGLEDITNRIMDDSLPFTKKQSWWSRWRDKRHEKKAEKERQALLQAREAEEAEEKAQQEQKDKELLELRAKEQQLKLDHAKYVDNILTNCKALNIDVSLLLAPPNAAEPEIKQIEGGAENKEDSSLSASPKATQEPEEALEPEVVEDTPGSEPQTDDGCLKF